MGKRFSHVKQPAHRVQALLESFSSKIALPLQFKPAVRVGDLRMWHFDGPE
jgi:hypothetical protein